LANVRPQCGPMLTGQASHQIGRDDDVWFYPPALIPFLKAKDTGKILCPSRWSKGSVDIDIF